MIKNSKTIDVQNFRGCEPIIYDLLFSCVDIPGNDSYCEIYPFEWEYNDDNQYESNIWKKKKSSEKISLEDAVKYFQKWLTDSGITEEDDLLVKMWW